VLYNTESSYGLASKLLHWLLAAGIIGLTALGAWMVDLSYLDSRYNLALSLHRSLGMAVLGLAVLFAVWKFVSPSPPLQAELRDWERHGARLTHALLLCAIFALPASGYVISTSAGAGFPFLDLFVIPAVFPQSETLRDLAIVVHAAVAYGFLPVVVVHASAALKHQFVDGHGTLKRML
jgi:cytochrome b561